MVDLDYDDPIVIGRLQERAVEMHKLLVEAFDWADEGLKPYPAELELEWARHFVFVDNYARTGNDSFER